MSSKRLKIDQKNLFQFSRQNNIWNLFSLESKFKYLDFCWKMRSSSVDFETVWKMHLILNFIAAWRRICWRMEPLVDFSLLSLPNATQEITLAAWGTHKHPLLSISWMVSFQKLNCIFQYQRTNLRRGRKTVRKEMWKWQMAVW